MVFRKLFRRKAEPDIQIEKGLEKTRRGVFSEITRLFDRSTLDDELYEDLEMLLIQADVGWDVSQQLVAELQQRVRDEAARSPRRGPSCREPHEDGYIVRPTPEHSPC